MRPEHAALDRVTLPIDDPFWQEYYPPNGWNCRCTVVQVRKSKYQPTPHDQTMALGEQATGKDTKGIFHFNPGIEQKTVPDYNPYTIRRCRDCDLGKEKLAFVPDNELCAACKLLHQCAADRTKSQTAIERKHYLHEMEHLMTNKHQKTLRDGRKIKVQFTTDGNKHLFSDTFGRTRRLQKEQLKDLGDILDRATYDDEAFPEPGHSNDYEYFYYFIDPILNIRLNVGKRTIRRRDGFIFAKYILYSINDVR